MTKRQKTTLIEKLLNAGFQVFYGRANLVGVAIDKEKIICQKRAVTDWGKYVTFHREIDVTNCPSNNMSLMAKSVIEDYNRMAKITREFIYT